MDGSINYKTIQKLPEFRQLIKTRKKIVWGLTLFLTFILLINIGLMSVFSNLGAKSLAEGRSLNLLISCSVLVIVLSALCCMLYVFWSNKHLDGLAERLKQKVIEAGGE